MQGFCEFNPFLIELGFNFLLIAGWSIKKNNIYIDPLIFSFKTQNFKLCVMEII